MRVGYIPLVLTFGFVCCGCVLAPNEGYITIHGQRHWFDGNEILPANLVDPAVSWDLHTGTSLEQYVYHYAGQPVILHVWWEVWLDGRKVPEMVASTATFRFGHTTKAVNCNGCIVASRHVEPGPEHDTVCLAAQVSEESGKFESILSKGYRTGVRLKGHVAFESEAERTYEPLKVDNTQTLLTYFYYTSEHPMLKQEHPSGQFNALPESGKLVIKLKARVQSFDPMLKDFMIGRRAFHVGQNQSQGSLLTSSDIDLLEGRTSTTQPAWSPD